MVQAGMCVSLVIRHSSFLYAPFALRIQRVVDDKLALENLVIREAQHAKSARNPPQPLPGRMRIARIRIGRPDDVGQQEQRRVRKMILFQDRVKRDIFAVVAQFAIGDVVNDSIANLRPVGLARQEDELCLRVYEVLDKPRASHAVDLDLLARDPLHPCLPITMQIRSLATETPRKAYLCVSVSLWPNRGWSGNGMTGSST